MHAPRPVSTPQAASAAITSRVDENELARVKREARRALEPFAKAAEMYDPVSFEPELQIPPASYRDDTVIWGVIAPGEDHEDRSEDYLFTVGDLRRARAALSTPVSASAAAGVTVSTEGVGHDPIAYWVKVARDTDNPKLAAFIEALDQERMDGLADCARLSRELAEVRAALQRETNIAIERGALVNAAEARAQRARAEGARDLASAIQKIAPDLAQQLAKRWADTIKDADSALTEFVAFLRSDPPSTEETT